MQDRASLSNSQESIVEEFDPLTINNSDEAAKKLNALFDCFPGESVYKVSQRYDFVLGKINYSIKLTKPLIRGQRVWVDVDRLQSRLAVEYGIFQNILKHFKQNSVHRNIFDCAQTHLLAFEDVNNAVIVLHVLLYNSLVLYPRKKDPNEKRFAVLDKKLSSGGFGEIYISRRSISFSVEKSAPIKIKQKCPDKYRVVKIQKDECCQDVEGPIATREYNMVSKLAPDLAPKPCVKNVSDQKSAMLMHYVQGETLWTIICLNTIKSDLERLETCLAVANALSDIHARGGIHCDVKPPNIICSKSHDGQVRAKFIDYGLSILQSDKGRCIKATVGYIAPELSYGKAITIASDVYSLGQSFNNVFGYYPSKIGTHEKSNCETLQTLGWNALLDDMCKVNPQQRVNLDTVIERLKSIIAALKAKSANQSRSIFSPAVAAASEPSQALESCSSGVSSLRL